MPLKIAIADDEPDMLEYFETILPRMGHELVAAARSGRELVSACETCSPDLLIVDVKMPEMDGIDAATEICRRRQAPVIIISAYHDAELIERASGDHILAYLVKPIKKADLEAAIGIAMARFSQFQALRREADDLRQALADRKIIERAKGIVMKRASVEEEEAFRRLQKLASSKNLKLVEMARMIVTAEDAVETSG
jgi:response regulator NasT